MSDTPSNPPSPNRPSDASSKLPASSPEYLQQVPPPPPSFEPKKREKIDRSQQPWRRRLRKTAFVLLILAITIRLIIFFAAGIVIRKVAAGYGLNLTYDRQELTLVGGDVGFWGLKILPKGGGQPFLDAEYVRGNISTIELLRGRLVVRRAEADGVTLLLERKADGEIPILKQLLEQATAPKPADAKSASTKTSELDFTPPLTIEALRLQHVRATVRDAAVTPQLAATISMDVRVSDLGDPDKPMRFDIDGWSDPVLDSLRITGQGTSAGRTLDALAKVSVRGFHPKPLAGYLVPLGIEPVGNSVGLDLDVNVRTDPLPDPSYQAKGLLTVSNFSVVTDDVQTASLESLKVVIDAFDTRSMVIGQVNVKTGRLLATRKPEGLPQFAGLAPASGKPPSQISSTTRPAIVATPPPPVDPVTPTTRDTVAAAAGQPAFALSVRSVNIEDIVAAFHDTALSPANDVKLIVNSITVGKDAGHDEKNLPVNGLITAPGLFNQLTIKGTATPSNNPGLLDLTFAIDQIRPDALRPYLEQAHVESLWKSGSAGMKLLAKTRVEPASGMIADVDVTDIKLSDGADIFTIPAIKIAGLGTDPAGRMRVASFTGSGPALEIYRDKQGQITFANFRWRPTGPGEAAPRAAATTQPVELPVITAASLPRLNVGSFKWDGVKVHLKDDSFEPPAELAITDAGVEVKDLLLDLAATSAGKPGSLRVWLNSPQLLKQFVVDGRFTPAAGAFTADLGVRGTGVATVALAPYLKPLGVEPSMKDGIVSADVQLKLARSRDDLVAASLSVADTRLVDGQADLAGVKSLQIENLTLGHDGLSIQNLHVASPQIVATRDIDNAISVMGFRLLATAPPRPQPPISEAEAFDPLGGLPKVSIQRLMVEESSLTWNDQTFTTPRSVTVRAGLSADDLSLGKPAKPGKFAAVVRIDDAVGELFVKGDIDTTPDAVKLNASVKGVGVTGKALAAYLPPGVEFSTSNGEFVAALAASLGGNPAGGRSVSVVASDIAWREFGQKQAFFSIESVKAIAPRIDPPGNVIAIQEISVNGIETDAEIDKDGAIRAMGIVINPTAPADASREQKTVAQMPAESVAATPPAATSQDDLAKMIAAARRPLPVITLDKLDVNLRRATLANHSHPDARPLSIENVTFVNTQKIELGGPDPNSNQPVKLSLTGNISPVIGKFAVTSSLTPTANEPGATIDVLVSGIRGEGVTEVVPQLREHVDGTGMTDGQFTAQVQGTMRFDKRGPRDFDLSRGFTLEGTVNNIAFRDRPDGPVLGGLESIRVEQIRVKPKDGSAIARSVEITRPIARIWRDKDGIHAFGLLVPLKAATTQPSDEAVAEAPAEPVTPEPAPAPPAEASAAPAKPAGEIAIQKLTVSGIDVVIEDRSVTPPFVMPLNTLDVDVRDITTRAMTEEKFVRFAAIVGTDKTDLPIPPKRGGGIPAALGGTAQEEDGSEPAPTSQRELFTQATAGGRVAMYPYLHGTMKMSINGLELLAFKGIAAEQKAKINRGMFDGDVNIVFRKGGFDTTSTLAFNDLSMSEPPDGPIARVLQLPGPLDAVIYGLEDVDRSITIPLRVPIDDGQLTTGAMVNAAAGAAGPIFVSAFANAPLKAARETASLVGLNFGGQTSGPQPVVIQFAPGSANLDPQTAASLAELIDQAARDSSRQLTIVSQLGGGDVPIAALRANPSAADCLAMASQLQARKAELLTERNQLAGEVRGQVATFALTRSESTISRLRAIDQEIANLEISLDQLYDMLKPGADRQAGRRTRAAGITIGQERLNNVKRLMLRGLQTNDDGRINVYAPQFNPTEDDAGGRVVVTLIAKTKS